MSIFEGEGLRGRQQELVKLKEHHAREIAALKVAHANEISALKERHASEIRRLEQENGKRLFLKFGV
jgi:hypothetical protein